MKISPPKNNDKYRIKNIERGQKMMKPRGGEGERERQRGEVIRGNGCNTRPGTANTYTYHNSR
jgi:hypothetical protein